MSTIEPENKNYRVCVPSSEPSGLGSRFMSNTCQLSAHSYGFQHLVLDVDFEGQGIGDLPHCCQILSMPNKDAKRKPYRKLDMLAKLLHLVMHDVLRVKVVSHCRRTPRTAKLAQE